MRQIAVALRDWLQERRTPHSPAIVVVNGNIRYGSAITADEVLLELECSAGSDMGLIGDEGDDEGEYMSVADTLVDELSADGKLYLTGRKVTQPAPKGAQ